LAEEKRKGKAPARREKKGRDTERERKSDGGDFAVNFFSPVKIENFSSPGGINVDENRSPSPRRRSSTFLDFRSSALSGNA